MLSSFSHTLTFDLDVPKFSWVSKQKLVSSPLLLASLVSSLFQTPCFQRNLLMKDLRVTIFFVPAVFLLKCGCIQSCLIRGEGCLTCVDTRQFICLKYQTYCMSFKHHNCTPLGSVDSGVSWKPPSICRCLLAASSW